MLSESAKLIEKKSEKGSNESNDKRTAQKYNNTLKGIIGACFWGLSIAISKICVQILDQRVPHLQLNAWRFFLSGCYMSVYLTTVKVVPTVKYDNLKVMMKCLI